MIKLNDSIQFESRRELEDLMVALATYVKEHKKDSEAETAQEMYDKLDVMHMCW